MFTVTGKRRIFDTQSRIPYHTLQIKPYSGMIRITYDTLSSPFPFLFSYSIFSRPKHTVSTREDT